MSRPATKTNASTAAAAHLDLSASQSAAAEQELKEIEADRVFAAAVLKRECDWTAYKASGILSAQQLGLLLDYDKQHAEHNDLWRDRGTELAQLLLHILQAVHTKETMEYVLVLCDEALQQEPLRALYFHEAPPQKNNQATKPIEDVSFLSAVAAVAASSHNRYAD